MSRQVWCGECAKDKQPGTRQALAATEWEPAEYERVVKGIARQPLAEQRVVRINAEPYPLSPNQYECDNCGAAILPGQPAMTWTVWKDGMDEPEEWENQYLELRP